VRGLAGQGAPRSPPGCGWTSGTWCGSTRSTPVPRPDRGQALEYLCFGRGDQVYLVNLVTAWPSFYQVLTVRLVPGAVRTLVGHPLDDDVAAIRFGQAQRAEVGRDDGADRRLIAGEVATVALPLTRSPSLSRGFTVQVEVERELYLDIKELSFRQNKKR